MQSKLREDRETVGLRGQHPGQLVLCASSIWQALIVAVALLVAAGVVVEILRVFYGIDGIRGVSRQFNLDAESNVPTWFSAIGLIACAVMLHLLAAVHRSRRDRAGGRFFATLAVVFVLLSLDESASFHEMLLRPVKYVTQTEGFLYFAWVIPGIAFASAVAVWSWNPLKRLPSSVRSAFLTAGALYCAGALGIEMIAGKYLTATHTETIMRTNKDFNYSALVIVEESLEMIGIILFLRALLNYLAHLGGGVTIQVKSRPD